MIDDCLAALVALVAHDVEIRILPSRWPLHDAVTRSTVSYSIIRMARAELRRDGSIREAEPRSTDDGSPHPEHRPG